MNIALDFDDTYTCDTTLWDGFIYDAIKRGHDIRIVTIRKKEMEHPDLNYLALKMPWYILNINLRERLQIK